MKKILAEAIITVCEEQGHEATLREGYVGRGFQSRNEEGYGVVVDDFMMVFRCILSDAMEECSIIRGMVEDFESHDDEDEEIDEFDYSDANALKMDSMGLQTIIY